MEEWNIEETENFIRDYKLYEKKHPCELAAVLGNLDTYFETLKRLGHPFQIQAGFIHHEPDGIKALDQKGGGKKVKLAQTRLYVYPDVKSKQLYLLAIGDKTSQKRDIQACRGIVKNLKN